MTISAWSHDAAATGSSLKSKIQNQIGQNMAEVQCVMDATKAHATINAGNSNYRDIDLSSWAVVRDWTHALNTPADSFVFDLTPSNGFFKVEAEIQ